MHKKIWKKCSCQIDTRSICVYRFMVIIYTIRLEYAQYKRQKKIKIFICSMCIILKIEKQKNNSIQIATKLKIKSHNSFEVLEHFWYFQLRAIKLRNEKCQKIYAHLRVIMIRLFHNIENSIPKSEQMIVKWISTPQSKRRHEIKMKPKKHDEKRRNL